MQSPQAGHSAGLLAKRVLEIAAGGKHDYPAPASKTSKAGRGELKAYHS
jgi:hypothetical protein